MKNLAIIFGGTSVEHDISILTGVQTLNLAKALPYNVIPIYIKQGVWYTGKALFSIDFFKAFDAKKLDRVFLLDGVLYKKTSIKRAICRLDVCLLATHGGEGENGELQALIKLNNLPICSTGTEGSAVTMNKLYATILAEALDIDVPPYMSICAREQITPRLTQRILKNLGDKVIIKPTHLGSSIGITIADNLEKLSDGLKLAFTYDTDVLCMECLNLDYELNIAIFSHKGKLYLSEIEKPSKNQDMLTFEDKYMVDGAKGMENMCREIPAVIPLELSNRVRRWAKKLYTEFGLSGVVRIDFLVSNGYLYFNEINTIPGSLALYLYRDMAPTKVLKMLIEEGIAPCDKPIIQKEFSSSVLFSTNFSKN